MSAEPLEGDRADRDDDLCPWCGRAPWVCECAPLAQGPDWDY